MNPHQTRKRSVWCLAAGLGAAALVSLAPATAATIEDFESYGTGTFPSPTWAVPVNDAGSLSSPLGQTISVQSNGNNLSGKHLQFSTQYPQDSVGMTLPNELAQDGDYVQVAVNVVSGRTLASIFLLGGPYPGGSSTPPAAIGFSTETNNFSFTHEHHGVFDASKQLPSATPSTGTWYQLRATMRDAGGAPGIIDSYDYQVFDSTGTTLITEKLGIPFFGGEGNIRDISLRSYEQSGTTNAIVLFDQVIAVVPEPSVAAAAMLAGVTSLGFRGRRRQADGH